MQRYSAFVMRLVWRKERNFVWASNSNWRGFLDCFPKLGGVLELAAHVLRDLASRLDKHIENAAVCSHIVHVILYVNTFSDEGGDTRRGGLLLLVPVTTA